MLGRSTDRSRSRAFERVGCELVPATFGGSGEQEIPRFGRYEVIGRRPAQGVRVVIRERGEQHHRATSFLELELAFAHVRRLGAEFEEFSLRAVSELAHVHARY